MSLIPYTTTATTNVSLVAPHYGSGTEDYNGTSSASIPQPPAPTTTATASASLHLATCSNPSRAHDMTLRDAIQRVLDGFLPDAANHPYVGENNITRRELERIYRRQDGTAAHPTYDPLILSPDHASNIEPSMNNPESLLPSSMDKHIMDPSFDRPLLADNLISQDLIVKRVFTYFGGRGNALSLLSWRQMSALRDCSLSAIENVWPETITGERGTEAHIKVVIRAWDAIEVHRVANSGVLPAPLQTTTAAATTMALVPVTNGQRRRVSAQRSFLGNVASRVVGSINYLFGGTNDGESDSDMDTVSSLDRDRDEHDGDEPLRQLQTARKKRKRFEQY